MADERVIIVNPDAAAREQFLREMAELRANPLDRAKEPGGYYLNADGLGAHDADGRPVPLRAGDKKAAEDLAARAAARAEVVEEAVPLDSPEEVADRQPDGPARAERLVTQGGVFTPAAVEPGQVLPDGTTSQPDARKAAPAARKRGRPRKG